MTATMKILTGAAGLAALVGMAAPAAAQGYPYGGGYGGNNGGVVGAIINSVIGGGRYGGYGYNSYGANSQVAVQQCAAAVEQRLNGGYGRSGYGGYGGGYGGYNGYASGGARVVSVHHVDRHSGGRTRVRGTATSGGYGGGYGGYGGSYGGYAQGDLTFKCDVDYRGYVSNLSINRSNRYGYNGY